MITEALGFLWSNQTVVASCRKHTDSSSDGAVNKCLLMSKIGEEERQWRREKELSHSIRVILMKPLGWSVFQIIHYKVQLLWLLDIYVCGFLLNVNIPVLTTGYDHLCSSLGTHWPLLSQSIYATQLAGKDFYLNVLLFRRDVMLRYSKNGVTGGYFSRVNPAKQKSVWLKSGN